MNLKNFKISIKFNCTVDSFAEKNIIQFELEA